ncbi:unnamed protein product [Linum trigynum]|uniref:Uncharacterized protein n=1 Tax=Linum trigynum TaxID=586398 RepID=A0AAV2DX72_9ROSI
MTTVAATASKDPRCQKDKVALFSQSTCIAYSRTQSFIVNLSLLIATATHYLVKTELELEQLSLKLVFHSRPSPNLNPSPYNDAIHQS